MLGLGGLSILALFRDRGWHPAGGLIAALSFSFGASAAWRIQHVGQVLSLSFLPIAWWLTLRALERRSCAYGFYTPALLRGSWSLGAIRSPISAMWVLIGVVLWRVWSRAVVARSLADASWLFCPAFRRRDDRGGSVGLTILLSEASNRSAIDVTSAGQRLAPPGPAADGRDPQSVWRRWPFCRLLGRAEPPLGSGRSFSSAEHGRPLPRRAAPRARGHRRLRAAVLGRREVRPFAILAALMLLYALGLLHAVLPVRLTCAARHRSRSGAPPTPPSSWELSSPSWPASSRIAGGPGLCRQRHAPGASSESGRLMSPFAAGAALARSRDVRAGVRTPRQSGRLSGREPCRARFAAPLAARAPAPAIVAMAALMAVDLAWNNGPNESTALSPQTYEALDPQSRDPLLETLKTHVGKAGLQGLNRIELTGLGFHWPNAEPGSSAAQCPRL